VQISGPAGMQVTFYRGTLKGATFDAPTTVGLRPGYTYRVQLANITGHPDLTLFPTLEVRGSLRLGNRLRNADFPATLVFSEDDFLSIEAGAMVTKVVTLEDPEYAIPRASAPDQPLQVNLSARGDPLAESQLRGPTMLLMHLGPRRYSPQELAGQGIPGTVLLPGERVLPYPRIQPWLPFACPSLHDPILGPKDPTEGTLVYDGGDSGLPVGFDREGRLRGLEPSDTVGQYTDSRGQKRLAISNCVAMCLPRFVVTRGETTLASQVAQVGPGRAYTIWGRDLLASSVPTQKHYQNQHVGGLENRQRPSGTTQSEGTAVTGKIAGVTVVATIRDTGTVQGHQPPPKAREPEAKPLKIIKWPNKCGGLIGEIITFFIRFSNQGGQPITDVIVSDSLTTRFEYVPGSAQSDRENVFTIQPNDGGSSLLRWEFPGTLQPGQSGTISFQVRIR
jgi:uncharacterized repeat protein (TIGR01451 family)